MSLFDGILDAVTSVGKVISPIASAISPVAGIASAAMNYFGAKNTNQSNIDQAQVNRQFQSDMSNTSYQRAVQDMQAAGLSPMLAYSQGGASTPSGSMAAPMQNALGSAAEGGFNSAAQTQAMLNARAQEMQTYANIDNIEANTYNLRADTLNKLDENPNIRERYKNIMADTLVKNTIARMNTAMAQHQEYSLPKSKAEGKYYDTFGYGPFALRDASTGISSAASAASKLIPNLGGK